MPAKVLGMVLAGGRGQRLHPLTWKRTKPAVPFGAQYRIIDFALNNMINSRIYGMYVLTQFKAQSLTEHIQRYWRFGGFLADYFITLAPAQMFRYEELGAEWYRGTADAIYQNLHLIENNNADLIAIFSGDHIYKMDISHMVKYHLDAGAHVTIAAYPTPLEECSRFGVLQVDRDWRITEFQEKPKDPHPIPSQPTHGLASMGNYIFNRRVLQELLEEDALDKDSEHDFGKNVLPRALEEGRRIFAYDFARNPIPGQHGPNLYWRDVGTLDSYHEASMDLINVTPEFDLYNEEWPLRSANVSNPPAKTVHESHERRGNAYNSLLGGGVIISGATVRESILFGRARVHSYATVERSVLLDHVDIGRNCLIRNTIIDKDVSVPEGTSIGVDPALDAQRGFTVTEKGIVVVPKSYKFT
ncbi:glucose-1-phosphate adenylyltransferase [Myxococcota bacterium]|nr:glucose-1-phosphate adenylyltransferase [Myxococcota bacterium]